MASYDALINLRVKGLNQLSRVEKAVNNINGKGNAGNKSSSRRRLTEEEKIVKEKIKGLVTENRAIRSQTQAIGLKKKGLNLDKTDHKLKLAIANAQRGQVDEANLLIQKATKAINLGKKKLALESKTTKAVVSTNKAKSAGNRITRSGISSSVFGSTRQPGSPRFKASRAGMMQGPALPPVIQGPASPIGGTRFMFGSPAQMAFSGGSSSPIRGGAAFPGSPIARALEERAAAKAARARKNIGAPKGVRSGGGALQSALISGAFPLLFGQGLLGGVAGAAGGGIGAAMGGQMGGFAGGLVATAALQAIQNTINGVKELGQALNPLTMDIGKLTQSLGIVGTEEARRLQLIQESQGKQAALAEATRSMALVIGDKGVQSIKKFSQNMVAIGGSFSRFGLRLQAGFAELFNNILDQLKKRFPKIFNQVAGDTKAGELTTSSLATNPKVQKLNTSIGNLKGQEASILAQQAKQRSPIAPPKFFDFLKGGSALFPSQIKPIVEEQKVNAELDKQLNTIREKIKLQTEELRVITEKTEKTSAQTIKDENDKKQIDLTMKANKENVELLEATLKGESEKFTINKKVVEIKKQLIEKGVEEKNINLESIKGDLEKEASLKRQVDLAKQLKSVLAEGMASAIEGLIQGTKSLGDSLRSVLQQFGSILLRTGISNMMGSSNLFGGFFGKGIGSAEGNYLANGIRPFASGGMVTRPTMGLVGEAGEDEYVIPASKMAQSMQRYSAGARGQSVIPGTGASSSGGASGSSTTVNYSGPILNFNSEEFVPKSAIGQIINSAASKGAAAGESRTMSTLRNSRGARARIGM